MKKLILNSIIFSLIFGFSSASFSEYFDSDGVKIFYTDSEGSGEIIVLVHGHTSSSRMWYSSGIATKLEEKYRVITLDCRGHGKSDKPKTPIEYGPNVGKDVINLLDQLEINQVHLAGFSMGAFVVGRLLVTNPGRIHTAILASGFFPTSDDEELAFQEHVAEELEKDGELELAAVARGWRYDAVSDEEIATITVPVQAVFGSEEVNGFFNSQKYRLRIPKSSLPTVVIEGADHDSAKAAILHPKFLEVLDNIIKLEKS